MYYLYNSEFLTIMKNKSLNIGEYFFFWKNSPILFLLIIYFYLFIFGCVGSSFSVRGLSLVAASGGHSSLLCAGLSLSRPLLLRSTGSRRAGSVLVAHGPSCSVASGIFPDQGSNPCPLHRQADSQPLRHQGSPRWIFLLFLWSPVYVCSTIEPLEVIWYGNFLPILKTG